MACLNLLMDAERARQLWTYDPETGVLRWRCNRGLTTRAGDVAGSLTHGYWRVGTQVQGRVRLFAVHRIAWLIVTGAWPLDDIDHLDGDGSNNRWVNLRDAPTRVNCQNRRTPNRSNTHGFLGVTMGGKGRWMASIMTDGRRKTIGYFDTPEEAHAAYVAAKRRLHEGCTI